MKMPEYEFRLLVNYGQGWEHETTESSRSDILARQREYRENCPQYPIKWRRVMVPWYVGHTGKGLEAFQASDTPTARSHPQYGAVVGPFRTMRAAHWAESYGYQNPHFQHVDDAERLAKEAT